MLRPLAVLALLLALALGACGDDDVSPSPTRSPTAAPSVTPSPSPTRSPAPGVMFEQLSYVGPDGEIRLSAGVLGIAEEDGMHA